MKSEKREEEENDDKTETKANLNRDVTSANRTTTVRNLTLV